MIRIARVLGAALFSAATVAPAHADGCLDTGKLADRAGACTWNGDQCASGYADATPQIMDDTYVGWACTGGEDGTYVCYSHARTYYCTRLK